MSVNIKENGVVTKLSGLYNNMVGKIKDLADVQVSSPTNGQILQYDGTASKWKNQNMPASGHTYSTEKRAVGTWIDGRIIYEQTLIIDNITTTGIKSTYINNANMLTDVQAFLYVEYDQTEVSTGTVTHRYTESMCGFTYSSGGSSLRFNDTVTVYTGNYKSVHFSFTVGILPTSTSVYTVSNLNAKIYATVQFVEYVQEGE